MSNRLIEAANRPRTFDKLWIALLPVVLVACSSPDYVSPVPREVIDLSPTLHSLSSVELWGETFADIYGIANPTEFEHRVQTEPVYMAMSTITLHDHVGPHIDAPKHLIPGGNSIDEVPLDKLIGPARVIDLRDRERDEPLLTSDFEGVGIEPGEIVIAVVGYRPPTTADGIPSYPYLSREAAEYLAGIPVRAFASDMPSTGSFRSYGLLIAEEATSDHVIPEHLAFLRNGIPLIEGLANAEYLIGKTSVVFVGFPLKIEGASAGLIRAAALIY